MHHLYRRAVIARTIVLLVAVVSTSMGLTSEARAEQKSNQSTELNENGVKAMQAKDFNAAERLFQRAVTSDPYNLTAVFNLAGALLSQKKNEEAISLLNSYVKKNTGDAGLLARLGDAYFTTKRLDDAKRSYEDAYKLAPKYLGLQAKLGTVYALKNDLVNAEKMLKEAVTINQNDGESLANLAAILLARGNAREAVSVAKRALQVKPSSQIYVTMGGAYEKQNDPKNALISYKRAQDLGDKRAELIEKIEVLSKVAS